MQTFEWVATNSAPREYPAFVIAGLVSLSDGNIARMPDGRLVNGGWGKVTAVKIIGDDLKAPPVQLDIAWYGFIEDKFYQGQFTLPTAQIVAKFNSGITDPDGNRQNYNRLTVGVAPGGDVSLWVGAERIVHQIAAFRASETTRFSVADMSNTPGQTLPQFQDMMLEGALSSEEREKVHAVAPPIGQWGRWNRRFAWTHRIEGIVGGDLLWITAANGEVDWFDLSGARNPSTSAKGAMAFPSEIELTWRHAGRDFVAQAWLDPQETERAFATLADLVGQAQISLVIEAADEANALELLLQADQHIYRFAKARSQILEK